MSAPTPSPLPYRVIPSARVLADLDALVRRAYAAGHGPQAFAALKQMERRLRIYPQFGEKLTDLHQTGETLWLGTVPPLVVKYVIDETVRAVFIGTPVRVLPNSGFK